MNMLNDLETQMVQTERLREAIEAALVSANVSNVDVTLRHRKGGFTTVTVRDTLKKTRQAGGAAETAPISPS